MPQQVWNFLLPATGTHTFRWTGSTAFIDNEPTLLIPKHPDFACDFEGAKILLHRLTGSSPARGENKRWGLSIDGRLVEEQKLGKETSRDLKEMKVRD